MARNRADDVEIELIVRRSGARLVSISENIDDSPSGILLHGVIASVAEFYSANLAAEVKKGMQQKAKSGRYPGKAPIGYRNTTAEINGRPVRTIVIDEARADMVRWCFEEYATGNWTLRSLLAKATAQGFTQPATHTRPEKPVLLRSLHVMLKNPFYTGSFRWKDVEYAGEHEPIISRQLFEQVQDTLAGNNTAGRNKSWNHLHYLKGTIFCNRCQSRMGYSQNNGRGGTYGYFYCLGRQRGDGCNLPYMPVGLVEEQIEHEYQRWQLKEPKKQELLQLLKTQLGAATEQAEREVRRAKLRLDRLERERDKLMQAHYADAITIRQMKKEQSRISRNEIEAQANLDAAEKALGPIESMIETAISYIDRSPAAYSVASDEGRRDMNHTWWKRFFVDDDAPCEVEIAEPIRTLLDDELPDRLRAENEALGDEEVEARFWEQIRDNSKTPDADDVGGSNVNILVQPSAQLSNQGSTSDAEDVVGSNVCVLVGADGLEPPTFSL